MDPGSWLVQQGESVGGEVDELALRLAIASGDLQGAGAWLVRNVADERSVAVVLGGRHGAEVCLLEHRVVPLIALLDDAGREEVLHGLMDAFRAGRTRRWEGHAALIRLAGGSSDEEIRRDVLEPWFARMALCAGVDVSEVLDAYEAVDAAGGWMVRLLEQEMDLPVEVLARLAERVDAGHGAAQVLPWSAEWSEEWAANAYARRLLQLASEMTGGEHQAVLARLGVEWDGTLGDLVTCVQEVTRARTGAFGTL